MKYVLSLTSLLIIFSLNLITAQSPGELLFSQKCTVCHTVGGGKLIGPDLSNIHQIRENDWLIKFIKSSQSLINSGDPLAVEIFNQYNKVVMPDQPLSDSEINSILDYIAENSVDTSDPTRKTPSQIFSATSVTEADIDRGKKLFEGSQKFSNGGTPCITCHNIDNPVVFTGGMLAKDLTLAFSRLSPAGVDGILRNPPFPAMANSYSQNSLTDQEIKDLLAFLYFTDSEGMYLTSAFDRDSYFLISSLIGINAVFLVLVIFWRRVKKRSTNR